MTISEFPEYFCENFNSHMVLIKVNETTHSLQPPNQCDWSYTITKISDIKYVVKGYKDDVFSFIGPEECEYIFEFIDDKWKITNLE